LGFVTTEAARRAYTPELKADAVALHLAGHSIEAIAEELDVTPAVVQLWVLQAETNYAGEARPALPPKPAPFIPAVQTLPTHQCAACGRGPAIPESLRSVTGIVIAFRMGRLDGTFCRDCGTSMARRALNRTLLAGWWGLFAGIANLYAITLDLVALRHFRQLPAPEGAALTPPLAPGKPLFKRAGVYVGGFVLLCSLLVGLVVVGYESPATRFNDKCISFRPNKLAAEPDCNGAHDGRVIGVVGKRTLCPSATDATMRLKSDRGKTICIDLDQ
jgi:hypothetical protein